MPESLLTESLGVFVEAFCQSRSRTYPYSWTREGWFWVMQDDPPRRKGRRTEIVGCPPDASEGPEFCRRICREKHFYCDVIATGQDMMLRRKELKAAGYRTVSSEQLFVHDLATIPTVSSHYPVRTIRSEAEYNEVHPPKSNRPFMAGVQHFVIADGSEALGWVYSRQVGDCAWVGDLYVLEGERGKGYGTALMSALLQHQKETGIRRSVLLASKAGGRLYPHLGYTEIGMLQITCPMPGT